MNETSSSSLLTQDVMRNIAYLIISALFVALPGYADNPTVGVVVPLSGPLAEYGVAIRNGIEMSQKLNQSLNNSVQFAFEDSQYNPTIAVSAVRKLAGQGACILYNFGGPTSEAIAPVVESLKIPGFLWTTDPKVVAKRKYIVRFANSAAEYEKPLSVYLETLKAKRLALVLTENQYLNSLYDALHKQIKPEQSITILQTYQPTDTDFRDSVARLGQESFDAVGVFLLSGQVSNFYRRLAEHRLTPSTFGTDFFESTKEIQAAGAPMQGAVYSNNEVQKEFAKHYRDSFGNDIQMTYAGNGYDFATLIERTLETSADANAILSRLKASSPYQGMLGEYSLIETSQDRYFKFPVVLKQIKGKSYKKILK